jgi:hypothetical protein
MFFSRVSKVFESHAPLVTKTITTLHTAPWFDAEYKEQRKLRRKAERRWFKSKSDADYQLFREIRNETTNMAKLKKQKFYQAKIKNKDGDIKAIFNVVNRDLDRKQKPPLPDCSDVTSLAKEFNQYFIEKIQKIRETLDSGASLRYSETAPDLPQAPDNGDFHFLDEFEPCTTDELRDIIADSGIKCSPSDFVPTEIIN